MRVCAAPRDFESWWKAWEYTVLALIGESIDPDDFVVGAYLTDKVRTQLVFIAQVCTARVKHTDTFVHACGPLCVRIASCDCLHARPTLNFLPPALSPCVCVANVAEE